MELKVERDPSVAEATIGKLSIDGVFECYTLEDQIREQRHPDGALVDVASWKIDGKTAIPSGTYAVIVNYSSRFKKLMPQIIGVPGFSGVRIHSGNKAEDTEGCILLGQRHGAAEIFESRAAFEAFFPKLQAAFEGKEPVKITIVNFVPVAAI